MTTVYSVKDFKKLFDSAYNISDIALNLPIIKSEKDNIDYTKLTNEELLEILKQSKDFEKFVFPNSWYEKYDLPLKECSNMKEYLKESPWMKKSQNFYISQIEDIQAKPGGNRPILEAPEIPQMVVIQNSFSDASNTTEQNVVLNQQGILQL